MRVVLYYPPLVSSGSVCAFPSLPTLAGYLKAHSDHDVVCKDINIDVINAVVDGASKNHSNGHRRGLRDRVTALLARTSPRNLHRLSRTYFHDGENFVLPNYFFHRLRHRPYQNLDWFRMILGDARRPGKVARIQEITHDELSKMLTSGGVSNDQLLKQSMTAGYIGIDDPHHMFCNWRLRYDQLRDVVDGKSEEPAIDVLGEDYFTEIQSGDPAEPMVVGFSVGFLSQFGSSVALARHIKRIRPNTVVVVGGSLLRMASHNLVNVPELFDVVDCFVDAVAGEDILLSLANRVAAGDEWRDLPGLAVRDEAGSVQMSPAVRFDIKKSVVPDYTWTHQHDYLDPDRLLIRTSVGCYWDRCKFCVLAESQPAHISVDQTAEQMIELSKQRDKKATLMGIVTHAMPLSAISKMCDALIAQNASIHWYCYTRFDDKFIATRFDDAFCRKLIKAGCHCLQFGLEAGTQRVNNLMDKAVDLDNVQKVLDLCRKYVIRVSIGTIIGFPGETEEEMLETLEFTRRNTYLGFRSVMAMFSLKRESYVFDHPEEFGIDWIEDASDSFFSEGFQYEGKGKVGFETMRRIQLLHAGFSDSSRQDRAERGDGGGSDIAEPRYRPAALPQPRPVRAVRRGSVSAARPEPIRGA